MSLYPNCAKPYFGRRPAAHKDVSLPACAHQKLELTDQPEGNVFPSDRRRIVLAEHAYIMSGALIACLGTADSMAGTGVLGTNPSPARLPDIYAGERPELLPFWEDEPPGAARHIAQGRARQST
jgi:hypothetical protein